MLSSILLAIGLWAVPDRNLFPQIARAFAPKTGYSISGSTRNAFLQGQYAEVGIRANGAFGSNLAPPSGFHQNVGNCLGFRVDRGFDGWGVGTDDGDFFCPGTPYEGYSIRVAGGTSFNECDSNVGSGITGSFSDLSTSDGVQSVKWSSTTAYTASSRTSDTGIKIVQVASVPDTSQVLHIDITLQNTSIGTLSDIYYARTFDPDNMTAPSVYSSTNTVLSQASASSKSQVRSTWTNGSFIMVESADTRSKAARYVSGGFGCSENPANVYNGTSPWTHSTSSNTADQGTGIAVYVASLAAGASTSFRISYVLSSNEANIPTAPTIGTVTPNDGALSVAFTAPAGGSEPTNYEYSTDGGSTWVARDPVSTTSPLSITGLTNGTSYSVKLRAKNSFGTGPASDEASGTPRTTPSAPRLISIGSTTAGLEVYFDAGADGGSAITNYKYASSTDGTNFTDYTAFEPVDVASPVVVGGLSAGTNYYIKLKAVSAAGDGAESNALQGSTSSTPGPPTLTTITAQDGAIDVSFTAGPNGGSAILNYKYQVSTDGSTFGAASALSPPDSASPVTIDGLSNGTLYYIRLIAVNASGDSIVSNVLSSTPASLPTAPTLTNATTADSDNVVFTAGATGGASITNYEYSLDEGATWNALSPPRTTSPLSIPVESITVAKKVQIRAVNSVGSGPSSNALEPRTVPSAPTITSIAKGDGFLDVNFVEGSNGGGVITNIEYSTDGGTNWTTPAVADSISPIRIATLTNGTSYSVKVRAVNLLGSGAGSVAVSATPKGVPLAPTITSVTPSDGTLTVSFTGASPNGSSITNYQFSTDGGKTWTSPSPEVVTSPLAIAGLTNGTSYSIQIRAVNEVGIGKASETTVVSTPILIAGAPTIISVTGSNQTLSVAFTAGGGTPTNYQFSTDGGTTWQVRNPVATTSPLIIAGLANGTTYSVAIRAVTASGTGTTSELTSGTPFTTPGAPSISSIAPSGTSLTVNFSAPESNGGNAVTNYQYSTNAGTSWSAVDPASTMSPITITGLAANTLYNIKIRAVNSAGAGAASSTVEATTGAGGDVTAPTVSSFTSAQSTPTNVSSFTYTLTFSESVTGVAAGDFTNTGTASGCSFAPGTDSGSSRTVTVSGCGEGTVTPRFAANGASDAAGNAGPVSAATASTTITRDTTAPTVTLAASAATSTSVSISFTVTGSEAVTCSTLSTSVGTDFTLTNISTIDSIVQTSSTVCTVNVTSSATAGGGATVSTLTAAAGFSMTDSAGNAQTTLTGSPKSTTVTIAAATSSGGGGEAAATTSTSTTTTTSTTSTTIVVATTITTVPVVRTTVVRRTTTTTTLRRPSSTTSSSVLPTATTNVGPRTSSTSTSLSTVGSTVRPSSTSVLASVTTAVPRPVVTIRPIVVTTSTAFNQRPSTGPTVSATTVVVSRTTFVPTTQLIRDIPVPSVVAAINEKGSNVQDLSLPVYLNNQLPEAKPNQPISIQSGQPEPVSVAVVNEQAVQLETDTGLSLSVTSLNENGEVAPLAPTGAIRLTERRTVVVSGRGFLPKSEAVVWIFSTPTRLGVIPVSDTGRYGAELVVGSELEVGQHTLQVNGVVPSGEIRSMNVALEIVETDTLPEVATTIDDSLSDQVAVAPASTDTSTGSEVMAAVLLLVAILGAGIGALAVVAARRRRERK